MLWFLFAVQKVPLSLGEAFKHAASYLSCSVKLFEENALPARKVKISFIQIFTLGSAMGVCADD